MDLPLNIQHSISQWMQKKDAHNVSKLSSLTGVSRATIKNIKMGRNKPRMQTAYKILEVTEGRDKAFDFIKAKSILLYLAK